MGIDVTVILPSYNRYPLNLLTLYSLENQIFDFSKMEVILIDDASTDDTHLLQHYRPPYPYRYIRNRNNEGRSKTRNMGIQAAKGEILIFLDAEVMVDPHFVSNHVRRHVADEAFVITGKNVNKVYSHLFPQFSASQVAEFYEIAEKSPLVKERFEKAFLPQKLEKNNVAELIRKTDNPVALIGKEDCQAFSRVECFSAPKKYEKRIIEAFRDDFALPWIACTTLNHSVRKELVEKIGGFDESFVGHGLEDYEYGFRLFLAGVKFSYDPSIYVYHQEHPIDQNWEEDGTKNLILFQQKHPCLDVYLLSLSRVNMLDYPLMDSVLKEEKRLMKQHPGRFRNFRKALCALLREIPLLKSAGKPITKLLVSSGIESNSAWSKSVQLERKALESNGFANLTRLYDFLVRL